MSARRIATRGILREIEDYVGRLRTDRRDAARKELFNEARLSNALDSRERAQNAARLAAETRARVRSEVERSMAEVAALLAQVNARMATAEKNRGPRRNLREAQQLLASVNADVQKAGAAMKAEDYIAAQPVLSGIRGRIQQVMTLLEQPPASQSSRRPQ